MRIRYRRRRDALVEALAGALPDAVLQRIAAGLHAAVQLLADDERATLDEARRRGIALATMGDYRMECDGGHPALLLGYAQAPEPTIRLGIIELAAAVRAARIEPDR